MNTPLLFTAASILALAGGEPATAQPMKPEQARINAGLPPKGAKILFDQNSNNNGKFIVSENFTSGNNTTYNNQAADDFVVPKGQSWTITEVDVSGVYYIDSGPATSESVIFYTDRKGKPGKPVKKGTFAGLKGTDSHGNFVMVMPGKGLPLKPGTYWVSITANMDLRTQGQWGWNINSVQHGNQAMWQNPNGGFDVCTSWDTVENCGGIGPDVMFDLRGKSKHR